MTVSFAAGCFLARRFAEPVFAPFAKQFLAAGRTQLSRSGLLSTGRQKHGHQVLLQIHACESMPWLCTELTCTAASLGKALRHMKDWKHKQSLKQTTAQGASH